MNGACTLVLQTSTLLTETLIKKPILQGVIKPCLEHCHVMNAPDVELLVLIDGSEMDGRRLARAEAHNFVAPGGKPTEVHVTLPTSAFLAEASATFIVTFHHGDVSAQSLGELAATIEGKHLQLPLSKAVLQPALRDFKTFNPSIKFDQRRVGVQVDGQTSINPSAAVATFVPAGRKEVRVCLVLPGAGGSSGGGGGGAAYGSKPRHQFTVEVMDSNGAAVTQVDTALNAKWMEKRLGRALLQPLLDSQGLGTIGWSAVSVDGSPVGDANATSINACVGAPRELGARPPTRVVVTLNPAPGGKPVLTKQKKAEAEIEASLVDVTFGMVISLGDKGVMHASSTRPTHKWVKGKSLLVGLINPALRAAHLLGNDPAARMKNQYPTLSAVLVDGVLVDEYRPFADFARAGAAKLADGAGGEVKVAVHLDPPGATRTQVMVPCSYVIEISLGSKGVVAASSARPRLNQIKGKTLKDGLVLPALRVAKMIGKDPAVIIKNQYPTLSSVSVDGVLVDETRPFADFVNHEGGEVTLAIHLDPPGASKSVVSVPCTFVIDVTLGEQGVVSTIATKPVLSWVKGKTLMAGLITPALKACHLAGRDPCVSYPTLASVTIEGTLIDPEAPMSEYINNTGNDIAVGIHVDPSKWSVPSLSATLGKLSLNGRGRAKGKVHDAAFIVDIVNSYGEVISTMETSLKGKWLDKPLTKALLEPACAHAGVEGHAWEEVTLDGVNIDERSPVRMFAGQGGGAKTRIKLILEARV